MTEHISFQKLRDIVYWAAMLIYTLEQSLS